MNQIATGVLLSIALSGCATADHAPRPSTGSHLISFEFLGCRDEGLLGDMKPNLIRLTSEDRVTFLTSHIESCGLNASNPTYSVDHGKLLMDYTLSRPGDSVTMCDCEYWAKFTFDQSMLSVKEYAVGRPAP
jgi:hypothetical protein